MVRFKNRWLLVELIPMSSLSGNTHPGQLASREERQIRRRLPDPSLHISSSLSSPPSIIDLTSNDHLSPTSAKRSGGSRFLINAPTHSRFESRLRTFFNAPQVLLFNSGSDANVGLFSAVPQRRGVVYDEYIHARDIFLSRERREFRQGSSSIFVSVESLYSMDGTLSALLEITQMIEETSPLGNVYLVVDEAHSAGFMVQRDGGALRVWDWKTRPSRDLWHSRRHWLRLVANDLIRDYRLNYAPSSQQRIADDALGWHCRGSLNQTLGSNLFAPPSYLLREDIPTLTLPTHTYNIAASRKMHSRSFRDHPTLDLSPLSTLRFPPLEARDQHASYNLANRSKGQGSVRICLHAGSMREEVDLLVRAAVDWAEGEEVQGMGNVGPRFGGTAATRNVGVLVASKL
ncbi:8-amino-7-oxononanoate synthase [Coprinopsis sp. MPI-PUGE-AT-0042]|nr:8-amino-7-oxononanoate synthase [Coprinopsis sp. MPI-PUGE-AT-0042]